MLKFQLATNKDLREAAIIDKKQRYEEERKRRIFNARDRILGVDYQGLDKQIQEKDRLKQEEIERDRKFLGEEIKRSEVLRAKEKELNDDRRRIAKEINDYRTFHQKSEDSREFDLNDPNYISNCLPARVGDNDSRLGISCAQKFLGEDLMSSERKKAQIDQQKSWLQQQITERQQAEKDRIKAEKILEETLEARDRRALQLEEAERNSRREIQASIARYNLSLASEQECRRMEKSQNEEEDNMAEIYNLLTSDMLTENPDSAVSNFGSNRIITTEFRGISEAALENIRRDQKKQSQEQTKQKHSDEINTALWDQYTTNQTRSVLLKEREESRKIKAINREIQEENLRLAAEQKNRNQYFDKVVYTNRPTPDYFSQFNTTTR